MNINKISRQIKICVKRLFVFLKKYKIENFITTEDFRDALMEIDLDDFWDRKIYDINEIIAIHENISYVDAYEQTFIDLLSRELLKNRSNFIREIDHIINALISHNNIQDFDYNEFKKRILDCGFNHKDVSQMQSLRIKDLSEMLEQIPTQDILPGGIDYQKYEEIFDQLKLPSAMFHYIFVCENILRKYIIQVLYDNGYPLINSIGHRKLSETIERQKNQEDIQNYLPMG